MKSAKELRKNANSKYIGIKESIKEYFISQVDLVAIKLENSAKEGEYYRVFTFQDLVEDIGMLHKIRDFGVRESVYYAYEILKHFFKPLGYKVKYKRVGSYYTPAVAIYW